MKKTGRNDPCPCGSGKKYKKCCMRKTAASSPELYYRRLSEAHDRLVDRLLDHAARIFGDVSVPVALEEFLLWPETEDEFSAEMLDRFGSLFWPWYVFNWEYDELAAEVELTGPEGRTVAELYAEARGDKLDTLERRLFEGINRKPYSFWEVLDVDKGKGMALQDILKGERIEVEERKGSHSVQPGDVLFGRAALVDGVGMLIGLATTLIPPGFKAELIRFRNWLQQRESAIGESGITNNTLDDFDMEIRTLYFDIDRSLHTMPRMQNTDGDALEFHKLVYDISSTEAAFQRLCDLCVTMTPEELRAEAALDEAGRIVQVEIPWDRLGHKKVAEMPNTVLGRIMLEGRRLTAEVNSAERARVLRREIDARLGDAGRFKVSEIQDLDAMMRRHAAESAESAKPSKHETEHEELMQHPEVQAQMAEMFDRHWENWVDQEIPALGGICPREAVKTADGREAVEALLKDVERGRGQDAFMAEINRKGAKRVRETLGLIDR